MSEPKRVCAWCSDRTGESYISVCAHSPAQHEAKYYCSNSCLLKAVGRMEWEGQL